MGGGAGDEKGERGGCAEEEVKKADAGGGEAGGGGGGDGGGGGRGEVVSEVGSGAGAESHGGDPWAAAVGGLVEHAGQPLARLPYRARWNGQVRDRKILVGLCCMEKKATSAPMKSILEGITRSGHFELVPFGNDLILNADVEDWPLCDCLISFSSEGFPLEKAERYVQLRLPFLVNSLQYQRALLDRRDVYGILEANGIPVPVYSVINRDPVTNETTQTFVEDDDYVEIDGKVINKPFVEKPVDADDHNVRIYFPMCHGGGCKMLFRKVNNRSSEFVPDQNAVRREGSFIYEEFLNTEGSDVKVYTVGPNYAHAEARKSPVIDGRVVRDAKGKEVRYPVLLTPYEKELARKVCLAFEQYVCGFDLLRSQGKSYVCDVNGWSFVKGNSRYFEDCAHILQNAMLRAVAPQAYQKHIDSINRKERRKWIAERKAAASVAPSVSGRPSSSRAETSRPKAQGDPEAMRSSTPGPARSASSDSEGLASEYDASPTEAQQELRCVIAVVRHGDRTPKQKLKIPVKAPEFLDFFRKYRTSKWKPTDELKLKNAVKLQDLLDVTRGFVQARLAEEEGGGGEGGDGEREVAGPSTSSGSGDGGDGGGEGSSRNGHSSSTSPKSPSFAGGADGSPRAPPAQEKDKEKTLELLQQMLSVLEQGGHFSGINRKVQLKPKAWKVLRKGATEWVDVDAAVLRSGQLTPMLDAYDGSVEGHESADSEASRGGGDQVIITEALLVVKWGGSLTHAGRVQAEMLGKYYRFNMYPAAGSKDGEGLLRLQSTYRHDLKIFSSDEGRVQMAAAAFAKGLLDLEGELTPILVSLIQQDTKTKRMLDDDVDARDDMQAVRGRLYDLMAASASDPLPVLNSRKLPFMKGTSEGKAERMARLAELVDSLQKGLHTKVPYTSDDPHVANLLNCEQTKENLMLIRARWSKLSKEFLKKSPKDKEGRQASEGSSLVEVEKTAAKDMVFNLSKIPDIYDMVKHDVVHHRMLLEQAMGSDHLRELFQCSRELADIIVPSEYGLNPREKVTVGTKVCRALLRKILQDLGNYARTGFPSAKGSGNADATSSSASVVAAQKLQQKGLHQPVGTALSVENSPFHTGIMGGPVSARTKKGDDAAMRSNPLEPIEETFHQLDVNSEGAHDIKSPLRRVHSRIYFTSESHVQCLANVLCTGLRAIHRGGLETGGEAVEKILDVSNAHIFSREGREILENCLETNYMTNYVFKVFEDVSKGMEDPRRYKVVIQFSPGVEFDLLGLPHAKPHHIPQVLDPLQISPSTLTLEEMERFLQGLVGYFSPAASDAPSVPAR